MGSEEETKEILEYFLFLENHKKFWIFACLIVPLSVKGIKPIGNESIQGKRSDKVKY